MATLARAGNPAPRDDSGAVPREDSGAVPREDSGAVPPIRLPTRMLYGVGSVAYGVKDVAFRSFLLLYYNQVLGLPASLVSAAIMAALVVDAISDPIVGQLSDNLRTRWGRRHPLMYAAALPAAGSFLLLFHPPAGLGETGLFLWILVASCLVRTLITFYEIPSSSLAPELAPDYDGRTALAGWRYFFGVTGGLALAFTTLYIFLKPTPAYPVGQLNPDGYALFAAAGALIMLVSILLSTAGTHHRIPYLRIPPERPRRTFAQTLSEMREAFSHRGLFAILGFGMLCYTMIGLGAALALYFGTWLWGLSARELAILQLDGILAATFALLLAPRLSRRFGKKAAARFFTLVMIAAALSPYVLRLSGLFFANGSPWLVPALFAFDTVKSTAGIIMLILVHAMIADVVEDQEVRTGRRTEGLFYAAHSFMQKCVSGLGVFVAGLMLTAVNFPRGTRPAELDPAIMEHLVLIYVPVFACAFLAAAGLLSFYRISRASHEANLARLASRRCSNSAAQQHAEPEGN
ncbi:MAG: MFS transporter [Sphingomonadaceae bacterium]